MTIDEVLAYYLIDIADRCKKSPPILQSASGDSQEGQGKVTNNTNQGGKNSAANKAASAASAAAAAQAEQVNLERNNYHFYMTICVFV